VIASSSTKEKGVKLWNASNGELLQTLKGHTGVTQAIAFSPEGNFLVTANTDVTLKIWRRTSGELIDTVIGHHDIINSVAFSADGRNLVSGSADRTVKTWLLRLR
jgi:WD40 repeat protein